MATNANIYMGLQYLGLLSINCTIIIYFYIIIWMVEVVNITRFNLLFVKFRQGICESIILKNLPTSSFNLPTILLKSLNILKATFFYLFSILRTNILIDWFVLKVVAFNELSSWLLITKSWKARRWMSN